MLLVDIGNSRIKYAQLREGVLEQSLALESTGAIDSLSVQVKQCDGVFACTVANPKLAQILSELCERNGVSCTWIDSTYPFNSQTHSYNNPAELGNDRWVAMAGARALYAGNLCVVDCGTATTVDYISAEGQHRGGIIFAGLQTMRRALSRHTQDLPDADAPVSFFSRSTDEAVASGSVTALCAGIDRVLDAAEEQFSNEIRVLIGGGEAERVRAYLCHEAEYVPDLVLRGLAVAAGMQ
ncbi:MAG: type III pantothenate kinase [Pseudomonadota bacterium]